MSVTAIIKPKKATYRTAPRAPSASIATTTRAMPASRKYAMSAQRAAMARKPASVSFSSQEAFTPEEGSSTASAPAASAHFLGAPSAKAIPKAAAGKKAAQSALLVITSPWDTPLNQYHSPT